MKHALWAGLLLLMPMAAHAQATDPALEIVRDFNAIGGAFQAASSAYEHIKGGLQALIVQRGKEQDELKWYRDYFAGLSKPSQ